MSFRSLREIERLHLETELEAARQRLVLQWGGDVAAFDSLLLPEPVRLSLPSLEELYPRLEIHPSRRRAAAESTTAAWRAREARAARVPDLQLGAGVRHLADVDGTGLLFAVSLPLPIWNPMGGAVEAAEAERAAATARERQTALEMRVELNNAYERFAAAVSAWEGVRDRIRPAAEEALRLIIEGYRSGRLSYLEVQEGQQSLLEAEEILIKASAEVWRTAAKLERLVGVSLETLTPREEE
jgi:cobalt-zinc-cadmium efflux system outer membrane protein